MVAGKLRHVTMMHQAASLTQVPTWLYHKHQMVVCGDAWCWCILRCAAVGVGVSGGLRGQLVHICTVGG